MPYVIIWNVVKFWNRVGSFSVPKHWLTKRLFFHLLTLTKRCVLDFTSNTATKGIIQLWNVPECNNKNEQERDDNRRRRIAPCFPAELLRLLFGNWRFVSLNQKVVMSKPVPHFCHAFIATILSSVSLILTTDWMRSSASSSHSTPDNAVFLFKLLYQSAFALICLLFASG